ncbi:MAG: hypothetical protein CMJ64_10255 [Planctomycetaceae bacterium]|nr:hypothetical protein [Planctomycetaceae bacterium]
MSKPPKTQIIAACFLPSPGYGGGGFASSPVNLCNSAIYALGKIGPDAKEALPLLQSLKESAGRDGSGFDFWNNGAKLWRGSKEKHANGRFRIRCGLRQRIRSVGRRRILLSRWSPTVWRLRKLLGKGPLKPGLQR